MSSLRDGGVSDGWFPLPPDWVHHDRRVLTRNAHQETLYWFPIPDPSGFAGIGLALMDKAPGSREFWMWTDESSDRTARVVRLGHRRYVVELHSQDNVAVAEDPRRDTNALPLGPEERDVLGHEAVSPARLFSSAVLAESCARLWLDHGRVHDGLSLGQWV